MGTTEGEGVGLPTGAVGRGMKEWWDQRGGRASRGVMKFVWDTLEFFLLFFLRLLCSASVPAFAHRGPPQRGGETGGGRILQVPGFIFHK